MFYPALAFKVRKQKDKRFTRRQLHALRVGRERVAKAEARAESKAQQRAARRAFKALAVFDGCDPERTLALIEEDA